ncbi:MAG: hypothetical protein PHF64_03295 [Methanoregula sp.]|nr:hypothetical protein [Methanoregula sp.]
MAFQFPYGSKNFIGLHADGAAATAWVKAEHWDTTNDGLGDPQEGMMFYSTLVHQMYYWDGSTWINYSGEIEGGVYVDAEHGSDVSGDGTIGRPYATLAHACAQQSAPTNLAEFATPITFYVAAGEYVDNLTFPNRLHIKVVGDDCLLSGDLEWAIDPRSWDTFLLPSTNVPVLHFARKESANGAEIDSSVAGYSQGFRLHGEVVAYNAHTGAALPMPDSHILMLTGVFRDGCHIYNRPAGTGTDSDAPGPMKLFLRDSKGSTGIASRIVGEVDRDLGTMNLVANEVIINAVRSDVHMNGVCKIDRLEDCSYSAAWNINRAGGAYDYGFIGGYGVFGVPRQSEHIVRSEMIWDSFFGYDPAAVAPAHPLTTRAISFDRGSLSNMAEMCSDLTLSFSGFSILTSDSAYGRGWWSGALEESFGSKVVIPFSQPSLSFILFDHTYSIAANWQVDGSPLAANNRFTIELESGSYQFPKSTPLTFDAEFVDVIGKGCGAVRGGVLGAPNTVLVPGGNDITWEATNARLENIQIMQMAGPGATEYCLIMNDAAGSSIFKNIAFTVDPDNAGTVYAVLIDPALLVSVNATWEDCHTTLNRFLYGGDIAPARCVRCSAGDYSFGAWNGGAPLNVLVGGYFEDCSAGDMSFAATNVGGDVVFSGIANRCSVTGIGFACSNGGGGGSRATCSGTLTDCSASVERSFANSATGDADASGTFMRCFSGRYSFGCSGINTGKGYFSGVAIDCYLSSGSHSCFGGNSHAGDPTMCEFSGNVVNCTAGQRSFGGRGEFTGKARRCRARGGSFGYSLALAADAVLDQCECNGIVNSAANGPPGLFGGKAIGCTFLVSTGEVTAAIMLNGNGGRVFDCDLYGDAMTASIDAGAAVDAQIAHCRMPVDVGVNVTNLLADPHNMIDANYDPE